VIGQWWVHYHTVTSTNDLARAAAQRGAPEGLVITADYQTQGRGRRGREWWAPRKKNLLWSVVLYPPRRPEYLGLLTLLAGAAAARAVRVVTGLPSGLKWPNDLWLSGQKLGGVLAEAAIGGNDWQWAVVGIGLNVNPTGEEFPPELQGQATSLQQVLGREVPRETLRTRLEEEFSALYECFRRGEDEAILAAWQALDVTQGREVEITTPQGRLCGRVLGVDPKGALELLDPAGRCHRIIMGEVTLRW